MGTGDRSWFQILRIIEEGHDCRFVPSNPAVSTDLFHQQVIKFPPEHHEPLAAFAEECPEVGDLLFTNPSLAGGCSELRSNDACKMPKLFCLLLGLRE